MDLMGPLMFLPFSSSSARRRPLLDIDLAQASGSNWFCAAFKEFNILVSNIMPVNLTLTPNEQQLQNFYAKESIW